MRAFKIYVCIALFFIVVMQAILVGALIYGATKVKSADNSLNNRVNAVTSQVTAINKNLQGVTAAINNQKSTLTLPSNVSGY